ncbi:MAG: AarF/UbiB family protein [Eubacteriales bacterium]
MLIHEAYWQFTTSKILTLEYLNGIKYNNLEGIDNLGFSRMELALKLVQALFKQIMIDGFFHGDPHPGNVAVGPQGQIIFMDFGMAGRMNEKSKIIAGDLFLALVGRDADRVAKAVLALGVVPENIDKNLLQRDIELLQEKYYTTSLDRISLKEAIGDLPEVVFKYRVRLLPEFIMLAKSLMTLEGVVQELAPGLNIVSMAEPFTRKLVAERYLTKDLPEKPGRLYWI